MYLPIPPCRKFCRQFSTSSLHRAEARSQTIFCIRLRRKSDYIWLRFPWQENSRSTHSSSPSDKKFRNFIVIFVETHRSNYGKRLKTKSYSYDSSLTIYFVACRGEYLLNFDLELNPSVIIYYSGSTPFRTCAITI